METLIIELYKYFSQFVPKDVLNKMFIQPAVTQNLGYEEIKAEILAKDDTVRFPEIDVFVLSINEKYVEQRMKDANNFVLFVEYGDVTLNPTIAKGTKQTLSVTVAHAFPQNNNDNLNEVLIMNRCLSILNQIIEKMNADQNNNNFCRNMDLIIFPAELQPLDPTVFFGRGGWSATFKNSITN
ncbi:MAG: hypothetical protein LBN95_06465 [Prevotellaceae bacterium]|jgi:hypothetical protein|nr:hypothetical protein [Prevotellaceae bacterium]